MIKSKEEIIKSNKTNVISLKLQNEKYQEITETDFIEVINSPTSTFRTNCNTASLDNLNDKIQNNRRIDLSMVRIEELMNYCDYELNVLIMLDIIMIKLLVVID